MKIILLKTQIIKLSSLGSEGNNKIIILIISAKIKKSLNQYWSIIEVYLTIKARKRILIEIK